jgi:hypothetical protein
MFFFISTAPIFALLIHVVMSIVLPSLFPKLSPWKNLFIGFCCSFLSMLIVVILSALALDLPRMDLIGVVLVNAGATVSLSFCYFTFFNLNYTSLRIRLLREFFARENGLELSEILSKYNANEILKARLERLTKADELYFDGQLYRLGSRSNFGFIGCILNWFKRILRIANTRN